MKNVLILIMLCISDIEAVTANELMGKWQTVTQSQDNGALIVEKENLILNSNHTFAIVIFVSLEKGDAFIKDLRIEASGIWKNRDNMLVAVVQKVEVPFAKEIYLISQESLRNFANNFKNQYENEPIRISVIKTMDANKMTTINENLRESTYTRY